MSGSLRRPIFVVGCPRSGTTLVQCILSASSQAFSLPETHFFSIVLPALGCGPDAPLSVADVRRARATLESDAELPRLEGFWPSVEDRAAHSPLRAVDVFVALVDHFRPAQPARPASVPEPPAGPAAVATAAEPRAIEKTPLHVLHLEQIGDCFPDAVFVNVVRDPVDVVSSLLNVPWQSSRSVLSHAQRWTSAVAAAEAYAARQPRRLYTLRYETFVAEPAEQVQRLCAFVGLPYEPAMLEEFGQQAARNVGPGETWKRDVGRGVLLNRTGVWRSRMSPGQAWLIAQATRRPRRAYGYAGPARAPAASIARAALLEARARYQEARPSSGVVGAARHAGSVLRVLSAAA